MSPIIWMAALALATEPQVAEPATTTPEGEPCEDCPVEEAPAGPVRDAPPEVIAADWLTQTEPELHELGPGQTAYFVRVPGVRKVIVEVVVHNGVHELYGEPSELGSGIGAFMDVATEAHDAAGLEVMGDLHEISLTSWGGAHNGGVDLEVPAEGLERGLGLMREMLMTPAYPQKDITRSLREKRLYYEFTGASSLGGVSRSALAFSWFPADHFYGARPNLDQMKKLKSKDVLAAQAEWRASGPVTALVVGDVDWATVEPLLKEAISGLGTTGERAPRLAFTPPQENVFLAVDMPGQAQAALRLRMAAPRQDHEDEVAYNLTNWALGGHFLSRLNANLREDKGFTYGSGSRYSANETYGYNGIGVDVKVENTAAAVREIELELNRLVEAGITAEELDMAHRDEISTWNGLRETASSAAGLYSGLLFDQKTVADAVAWNQAVGQVTPEQTQAVAEAWMSPDQARVWVVAGDRKQLEEQFKTLAWDVQWITAQQAVLGVW